MNKLHLNNMFVKTQGFYKQQLNFALLSTLLQSPQHSTFFTLHSKNYYNSNNNNNNNNNKNNSIKTPCNITSFIQTKTFKTSAFSFSEAVTEVRFPDNYQELVDAGKVKPLFKRLPLKKQYEEKRIMDVFYGKTTKLVLHYDAMNTRDWIEIRLQLKECDARCMVVPSKTTKRVLQRHNFEKIAKLFSSMCCVVHLDDVGKLGQVLNLLKKQSKLHLLGAQIDDLCLNMSGIKRIESLPPIDQLRGELVALLSSPSQKLSSYLQQNQQALIQSLTTYSNPPDEEANEEGTPEKSE